MINKLIISIKTLIEIRFQYYVNGEFNVRDLYHDTVKSHGSKQTAILTTWDAWRALKVEAEAAHRVITFYMLSIEYHRSFKHKNQVINLKDGQNKYMQTENEVETYIKRIKSLLPQENGGKL